MADMPDDTTPAEALRDKVAVALHDADCGDRTCNGSALGDYYRAADIAIEAAGPLIAARAAAAQLQRDIQLATEYNARYVVYECPQSTRVGRVPVEYPFADLLAEDTP